MRCRYWSVLFFFTVSLLFFSCDEMQSGEVLSLTVEVSGPGMVTLSPNKAFYEYGETVELTAVSYSTAFSQVQGGCVFDSWGDDDECGPARTVILTADVSLDALFCIDPDGDSDGDGKLNRYELDEDGTPVDSDADGIPDYLEPGPVADVPVGDYSFDRDMDGRQNYDDDDDDGDGTLTLLEDLNGNGCWFDDDPNNNGIPAYLDFSE